MMVLYPQNYKFFDKIVVAPTLRLHMATCLLKIWQNRHTDAEEVTSRLPPPPADGVLTLTLGPALPFPVSMLEEPPCFALVILLLAGGQPLRVATCREETR